MAQLSVDGIDPNIKGTEERAIGWSSNLGHNASVMSLLDHRARLEQEAC
jgi:hypothetical protein